MGLEKPYLSLVVATRNDDHGGSLTRRTQTFLNALTAQCARHKVRAELVFVEWNPPADRPPLAEALNWPRERDWCQIRIIRVPREIHARYAHGDALPLYQMIAKNVGIRRARGEFILATNIDILFSDELMEFIASGRLEKGKMYRIDRLDVESDVPMEATVDEQLEYCRRHLIRINSVEATIALTREGLRKPFEPDIVQDGSGIYFGEGWYQPERSSELFRWMADEGEIIVEGGEGRRELLLEVEPSSQVPESEWWLELVGEDGRVIQLASGEGRTTALFPLPVQAGERKRFRLRMIGTDPDHTPKLPNDSRFLGLRAFRCEWHSGGKLPPPFGTGTWWRSLAAWFERVWFRIKIPDPKSFQPLDTYPDLGSVRHQRRMSGHFGVWTDGKWYNMEHYDFRTFRWAQDGARLLLRAPEGWPNEFRMLVGAGPGHTRRKMGLEVRDFSGDVIVRQEIGKRAWVTIPGPAEAGRTLAVSLHVIGTPESVNVKSDPRRLAFRLLDFGWGSTGRRARLMRAVTPETPRQGLMKLGKGWEKREDQRIFWAARNGAEVLFRRSNDFSALVLDVEACAGSDGRRLIARDAGGTILAAVDLRSALEWCIPSGIGPGELGLIRLETDRGTEEENGPILIMHALRWGKPEMKAKLRPFRHLHTNACGDFTLLHRDHWHNLRGYAEFDLYSMNLDSLFCWAAYFAGAEEVVLRDPLRIYHIEHGVGSGWTPEGQAKLFGRLAERGVGWLEYREVLRYAFDMNSLGCPIIFCDERWGLGAEDLEDVIP